MTTAMMYEAEVLFDFGGQESGDLAVRRGDVLSVVAEYEGRWCKAERKGDSGRGRDGKEKGKGKAERKKESGLVPLPYVRRIDATQERRDTFRALYSHAARNAAELGFEEGDVLTVIDQQPGRGWWRAELRGRRGLVPANYLEACARATPPPPPQQQQQQQPLLPTSSPSSPSSTSSQQQTPQQQQQQQQKPVQSGPADLKAKRLSLMLGNTGMLKAQQQQQQQQQQQSFAADFLDKLTMAVDGITGPGGSGKTLGRSTSTTSLIAEVNDLRYATYPFAEPDSEKNTCYKDGAFVGGNIYKVVGYLTSDATAVDEQRASEMRDFALTYKLNISAEQLLKCLVLRFEVPKNLGYSEDKIRAIQINTLTLIREWVKVFLTLSHTHYTHTASI